MDRSCYPPLSKDIAAWERDYESGPLTENEFKQFFEDGFVIKHDLLKRDQLESVIRGIERAVDELAQDLYRAGKIENLHENVGFYQRLTAIDAQFPNASVLLHKRGVLPSEVASLWASDALLRVAKQLLGPDIAGHPVWNLRTKVPNQEQATVPWHQDTAYLDKECWNVLQVTAWIPLLDANRENGFLQMNSVLRGGHRPGKTCQHNCCAGGTWYVELSEEEMTKTLQIPINDQTVVTCEVPFGSVLFLNNLVPHRSTENFSEKIRWSLDLRWQKPDEPNGFYGLKENILMAKENDENFKLDWEQWSTINRTKLQEAAVHDSIKEQIKELQHDDPFDTTISGPWMHNWPIVHHNKHTEKLTTNSTSWHKS
ncbi:unnamed protein product [Adineta ricciae]|uniref:Phytanoyl-CoA dioxygenase n=1 Tax=Adineta ricciae TaxID=249248 RepID=A0A816AHP0_ADIRI|nr:unnamed protein product [Adineta ricciae]